MINQTKSQYKTSEEKSIPFLDLFLIYKDNAYYKILKIIF